MHVHSLARLAVLLATIGASSRLGAAAGFDDPIHAPGFSFKLDYNWDGSVTKGFYRGYGNLSILDLRSARTLAQAKANQLTWFRKRGYKVRQAVSTTVDGRPAVMIPATKLAYNERWGAPEGDPTGQVELKSAGNEPMVYLAVIFMTKKGATGYFFEATEDAPLPEVVSPVLQSTHIEI